MDLKILSLHTGIITNKDKKQIDVRSIFAADSFPYQPTFVVGASVCFSRNSPQFILRFDIIDSDGNKLNEGVHEIEPDLQTFYINANDKMSALDAWLTPTDHILPKPGEYIIKATLLNNDHEVLDNMEITVLVSDAWKEINPWEM
ncbi:hypothetical protein [Pantoea eucrina]|uniref:hypothetical protein n=1 Tax=Pantoea eucrina TaxID=472693 RepID=UPI00301DC34E